MHIRPLTHSDLPAVVDVALAAFEKDEFHAWLQPRAHEPGMEAARRRVYVNAHKDRFTEGIHTGIVCVRRDESNPAQEKILGFAWWTRRGPADSPTQRAFMPQAQGHGFWFDRNIARPLKRWYQRYIDVNPVLSPEHYRQYLTLYAEMAWHERLKEHWYLSVLAVRPEESGQGVGTMLLRWGMERAEQERIPATLEATPAGAPVYTKRGFKTVDWEYIEGLDGGNCMIYDPHGLYVREPKAGDKDFIQCGDMQKKLDVVWKV